MLLSAQWFIFSQNFTSVSSSGFSASSRRLFVCLEHKNKIGILLCRGKVNSPIITNGLFWRFIQGIVLPLHCLQLLGSCFSGARSILGKLLCLMTNKEAGKQTFFGLQSLHLHTEMFKTYFSTDTVLQHFPSKLPSHFKITHLYAD